MYALFVSHDDLFRDKLEPELNRRNLDHEFVVNVGAALSKIASSAEEGTAPVRRIFCNVQTEGWQKIYEQAQELNIPFRLFRLFDESIIGIHEVKRLGVPVIELGSTYDVRSVLKELKPRVVIVEDDRVLAQRLELMLQERDIEVETIRDPDTAFNRIHEKNAGGDTVDQVLLDAGAEGNWQRVWQQSNELRIPFAMLNSYPMEIEETAAARMLGIPVIDISDIDFESRFETGLTMLRHAERE